MGFWSNLFGKNKGQKSKNKSYKEKDNQGTRQDTEDLASAYWVTRISSPKKDPFVLYTFNTEKDASEALLELPCIHLAEDTGRLICTETLTFGYYATKEGKYEAIVCGDDQSHDLWALAKDSFIRHGGKPRGQGELEPAKKTAPPPKTQKPVTRKVSFVREDRKNKMGKTFIYRIYKGTDAASAKAFLQDNPVNKKLLYIIVETPEGNYCRDIQGMYKE